MGHPTPSSSTGSRPWHRPDRRHVSWLLVALAALPILALSVISNGFHNPHDWESGLITVEARNFANFGILELGGLPLQNNPPLTASPDYYTNWPPLAPIILSAFIDLFGDRISVLQLVTALITLITAIAAGYPFRRDHGWGVAAAVGTALLLMPWTLTYGFRISMLPFGLAFGVGACVAWIAWLRQTSEGRSGNAALALGCCAMFLAVLSTWEPFFLLPGFLAASVLSGRFRQTWRMLALYTASAVAAVVGVFVLYGAQIPEFFHRMYLQASFRAGFSEYALPSFDPHALPHTEGDFRPGLYEAAKSVADFFRHSELLGYLGMSALPFALIILVMRRKTREYEAASYIILPFLAVWMLWALVFSQQAMIHEFEVGSGAIAAAASVGAVIAYVRRALPAPRPERQWLQLGLAAVLLFTAIPTFTNRIHDAVMPDSAEIRLGKAISAVAEPNAIILTPEPSGIPVYFAHRHLIRNVADEGILGEHREDFQDLCRDCFYYLAINKTQRTRFANLLADQSPTRVDGGWEFYRLSVPGSPLAAR